MRNIFLAITLLICTNAQAQVIRAEPFYSVSLEISKCFPEWDKTGYDTFDIDNTLSCIDLLDTTQSLQIDSFGSLSGTIKWYGGVLAPNGKIYGIPYNATTILEIDPVSKTTTTFGSLSGTIKWYGGVLAPNGKIYGIPFNATTILEILSEYKLDIDFPLSRIFNKF